MEIEEDVIKAYALENAIKYGGKANQGAVLSALFNEGLKKENVKEVIPEIKKIIGKVNSMSADKQEEEFATLKEKVHKRDVRETGTLPPLENATEGSVVMRFAPFPSGPLHIGNARQLILNDEYVKKYNGKLLLVMDDTIGSVEKPIEPEAYKLIEEGVQWLNVNYDKKVIYKSERLEKYYSYADELIKKGYMYVCDCPQEKIQELRKKGVACSCRELPTVVNFKKWKEMFLPSTKEGSRVVRLKTNMQDSDPAFRDRVMFRISEREHPRLKNSSKKHRVYPLLDFAWAIDDHLLGITHIIRGVELMMETRVEEFIWDIFSWKHPITIHTGHLIIEGVKISKSKGAKEVRAGEYIGWNDPRMWSLQSLRDRGIQPEAVRQFILNSGLTKSRATVPIDVLYSLNKRILEDKGAKRYFFVPEPVKIHIAGTPPLEAKLPLHPNKKHGFRNYKTEQDFYIPQQDHDLMVDGNYRLMHLLNFKTEQLSRITEREFSFVSENPEDSLKVKFIQWLPAGDGDEKNKEKNIKVEVRMPDSSIVSGLGESELVKLKAGKVIQFERFGFVRLFSKPKGVGGVWEFWFAHN